MDGQRLNSTRSISRGFVVQEAVQRTATNPEHLDNVERLYNKSMHTTNLQQIEQLFNKSATFHKILQLVVQQIHSRSGLKFTSKSSSASKTSSNPAACWRIYASFTLMSFVASTSAV